MMSNIYDCIVLGLGGFGSSAIAHLASNGQSVLGLDQYPPVHRFGSSHGRTRVIRQAYFEHPDYVPLLQRAYELWRQLEETVDASLYSECGLMLSGPPHGTVISGAREASRIHALELEDVTASEITDRFPAFQIPEDHEVVFEPRAGYLRVEDCVAAHLDVAEAQGAQVIFGERVQSWSATEKSVRVQTRTQVYEAASLVIAGGAWTSQILGDVLPPLHVLRKVQVWSKIQPEWSDTYLNAPVFYYSLPDGDVYGFPSQDGVSIKLCEHTGGQVVANPSELDFTCHEADRTPIQHFTKAFLRGIEDRIVDHSVCMYTMSPDEHFIIDRHPEHSNVILAAGFSGHGFKFTSVIGEALADMAMGRSVRLPMEFLKLDRFNTPST
ncbi:N-methyl-L-tryptophan oxidase [Planctomicrobium sp. SH668]|uniref:N-methyl-L-tryptophan oxidase n=1 Tax=Planctomicrobium sp. SH668 TaxID=3448126 RepID=UPI003F5B6B26